jgi:hypothetical protein
LKLWKNNQGQVRVIEAFLASLLLTGCIAIIPIYSSSIESQNLSSSARNILASLDNEGQLASLIESENWRGLRDSINSAIPLTLWYNLTVYDENMIIKNPFPICNGGSISDNINSIVYVSVSPNSQYTVYVLRLQVSKVGS